VFDSNFLEDRSREKIFFGDGFSRTIKCRPARVFETESCGPVTAGSSGVPNVGSCEK
jgi:hypothetical protein